MPGALLAGMAWRWSRFPHLYLMPRVEFDEFFVRKDRLVARAECGCEAFVKIEWVEQFALEENIDLGKEKFVSWDEEKKKKFRKYINRKIGTGQISLRCALHRFS